jgi:hypothetical protein
MAQFNLNDYETVEQRIKRFYKDNPDGRIITDNITTVQDRQVGTWVTKSYIYLTAGDQELSLPKASGLAFEVDSAKGPQATSALEVCETSSIGRALANANYSGNKRASREEMEKVARDNRPKATAQDWLAMTEALGNDIEGLRLLYSQAKTGGATNDTLDKIKAIANGLTSKEDSSGLNS